MRKLVILIVVLLSLPIVNAGLTINELAKDIYGVGEDIDTTVMITTDHHVFGMLKMHISCEKEFQVFSKVINLDKNKTQTFYQALSAPPDMQGECRIRAVLSEEGQEDLVAETAEFEISSELVGVFKFSSKQVQLGNPIDITGTIFRLDGEGVDGHAFVYMKQGNSTALVKTVDISEGAFLFNESSSGFIAGDYNIEVDVNDVKGSNFKFKLESITIVDELKLNISASETLVVPGKEVRITGSAMAILEQDIETADVQVVFGGTEYKTQLSNGKFEVTITVPEKFKSGTENVYATIEDINGNRGESAIPIEIVAVPTTLNFTMQGELKPGSMVTIIPHLYDQADMPMNESVDVQIEDPDGDDVLEIQVTTGNPAEYTLAPSSEVGDWVVSVSASTLENSQTYYIGELIDLDYRIDGATLYVTNAGNTKYKGDLNIRLNSLGQDTNIVKKVSIGVKEEIAVNLAAGIASGTYDVYVDDAVFTGISITGERKGFNIDFVLLEYIILGAGVLVILWLFFRSHRRYLERVKQHYRDKGLSKENSNRKHILSEMKHSKKDKIGFKPKEQHDEYVVGSHDPETIFGRKRQKQREEWGSSSYEPPKNDDDKKGDGGLFNMFG